MATGANGNRRSWARTVALVIGAALFLRVGLLYTFWTGHGALAAGLAPTAPSGLANLRVFAGAFHVGLGLVAMLGALRPGFARQGLVCLAIVTGTVVATRLGSVLAGSPVWLVPTIVETFALGLFTGTLVLVRDATDSGG